MISLDEKVKKIVELIEDKKGQEIKVYDLQGKSPFFDYSILCTGSSSRNIDAIATDIKKGLGDVKSNEGLGECNWVLIDSGDILISVFTSTPTEDRPFRKHVKTYPCHPSPCGKGRRFTGSDNNFTES